MNSKDKRDSKSKRNNKDKRDWIVMRSGYKAVNANELYKLH